MSRVLLLNTLRSILRNPFFSMAEKHQKRRILEKFNVIKKNYYTHIATSRKNEILLTLEYAIKHVPYYSENIPLKLLKKIQNNFDYFNDVPILCKKDITDEPDSFISNRFDKNKLIRMKTGGSTGHSMFVYYDQDAADWSSATTLFCRAQYENFWRNTQLHFACNFGDSPTSLNFNYDKLGKNLALNRRNIFTMSFDGQSLNKYLESLDRYRVNIVHGHPSTMYQIAQYSIAKYGCVKKLFRIFESSGEVLFPYQAEVIKNAFGCMVVNRYGLAEAGIVAYQMKSDDTFMEIQSQLVYMESGTTDEQKNIILTTLKNKAMPLIRYDTGDLGIFKLLPNGSIGLKAVQGRIHDFVVLDNKKIPTHALMDVFDHRLDGIHEWQIQKSLKDGSYKILVVPMGEIERSKISEILTKHLGVQIKFDIVTQERLRRVGHACKFRHLIEVE